MASLLVNGGRREGNCIRLLADKTLMNHFGSVVMTILVAGVEDVLSAGDINQLPFIKSNNLFDLRHKTPSSSFAIFVISLVTKMKCNVFSVHVQESARRISCP